MHTHMTLPKKKLFPTQRLLAAQNHESCRRMMGPEKKAIFYKQGPLTPQPVAPPIGSLAINSN